MHTGRGEIGPTLQRSKQLSHASVHGLNTVGLEIIRVACTEGLETREYLDEQHPLQMLQAFTVLEGVGELMFVVAQIGRYEVSAGPALGSSSSDSSDDEAGEGARMGYTTRFLRGDNVTAIRLLRHVFKMGGIARPESMTRSFAADDLADDMAGGVAGGAEDDLEMWRERLGAVDENVIWSAVIGLLKTIHYGTVHAGGAESAEAATKRRELISASTELVRATWAESPADMTGFGLYHFLFHHGGKGLMPNSEMNYSRELVSLLLTGIDCYLSSE